MSDRVVDIRNEAACQLEFASEECLISAAKKGGHVAYAELCKRCRKSVFGVVHRITKNREDTEDAMQDAWIRAFTHINNFNGRAAFSTWFTRIAINSALMILRKRKRHTAVSLASLLDDCRSEVPTIVEPSCGPEESFIRNEREILVRQAIQLLPTTLRAVVEAHQSQDFTAREVATIVGISLPAAKSRLVRARIKLREHLSNSF
jgi:RNA polymerase sigma factor (sigma-70 family)